MTHNKLKHHSKGELAKALKQCSSDLRQVRAVLWTIIRTFHSGRVELSLDPPIQVPPGAKIVREISEDGKFIVLEAKK